MSAERSIKAAIALVLVVLAGMGWLTSQISRATPRAPGSESVTVAPQAAASARAAASAIPAGGRPQVIEPAAGVAAPASPAATTAAPAGPVTSGIPTPTTISPSTGLAEPVSDAYIRQELRASGLTADPNQATLTPSLLAIAPIAAPLAVQQVIEAGNQIARLPYVWGGGHGTYADTGYDCSGSISYVFAAAHLLNTTLVSGELAHWGAPGPGKWITIFANAGHTFMYVAGLRFDTVALAETGSRWSNRPADESDLGSFAIRHPPGL